MGISGGGACPPCPPFPTLLVAAWAGWSMAHPQFWLRGPMQQIILGKIRKIGATTLMPDFKAKMHQIRFPPGLRFTHTHTSRWGAYSASRTC